MLSFLIFKILTILLKALLAGIAFYALLLAIIVIGEEIKERFKKL